jgi:asparagine synthase (glutamine-hydrolysing)
MNAEGTVCLGHTRLSIIDVAKSTQPLANEDGSVIVTFNGEIYNFQELRAELRANGHQFRTEGDTEVLVHLYEECGPGMVQRLDGMFAFAIYDARRRSLLLARDRVGIKPIYYWHDSSSGRLRFASDLQSILADGSMPRQLNRKALAQYLYFGHVVPPQTWIEQVRQLEPGQIVEWKAGQVRTSSFFEWQYAPRDELRSQGKALAKLRGVLEEAVEQHLVADVPLGSFLSGGIDSTVVTALAQRHRGREGAWVNSYTVRFWTKQHDESPRARSIARDLGTRHTELDAQEIRFDRGLIEKILRGLAEPHADTSALAVYFLCQQVRPHIKVALSGDGGDELFFGYKGIRKQRLAHQLGWAPTWMRRAGIALTKHGRSDFSRRINKYLRLSLKDNAGLIIDWARRWEWKELGAMLDESVFAELFPSTDVPFPEIREMIGSGEIGGLAEQQLQYHMRVDMPCDCLFKVDRMSMAHGLEVRVPLLSNKMLEYGQQLPIEIRAGGKRTKEPLRSLAEGYAPTLLEPALKHGFGFPLDCWMRGKAAKYWREWDLTSQLTRIGFQRGFVERLVNCHNGFGPDERSYHTESVSTKTFDLLLLALWLQTQQIRI